MFAWLILSTLAGSPIDRFLGFPKGRVKPWIGIGFVEFIIVRWFFFSPPSEVVSIRIPFVLAFGLLGVLLTIFGLPPRNASWLAWLNVLVGLYVYLSHIALGWSAASQGEFPKNSRDKSSDCTMVLMLSFLALSSGCARSEMHENEIVGSWKVDAPSTRTLTFTYNADHSFRTFARAGSGAVVGSWRLRGNILETRSTGVSNEFGASSLPGFPMEQSARVLRLTEARMELAGRDGRVLRLRRISP